MSLFAALTVAVGGLNAQSRSIGHISDNISNASSVGFKRIDTAFQSLVTQSNLTINDPGGVRATPSYQNNVQGNLIQSQASTSLAISGAGFFNVRAPAVQADGSISFATGDLYSRRGDFQLDKDGYMVNGAGHVLMGHTVSTAGVVDKSQVGEIQISSAQDNPVATSTVELTANLPASGSTSTDYPSSSIQIFDSLGVKHSLTYDWTKLGTNNWRLAITLDDATNTNAYTAFGGGAVAAAQAFGTQYLDFNFQSASPAGTIDAGGTGLANRGSGTFFTVTSPTTAGSDATVSMNVTFSGAGAQTITLDFGAYEEAAGVTQFDATDLNVSSFEQNGVPQGSFRDISIDDDGFVYINYDNGRSRTLYQIPIVTFNSPNSLQRKDGGAFAKTTESGNAKLFLPGNNGAGKIVSNTLEGANVDIADEFTKMIQAQRIYSANARTITTSNSMLEEVINIVR